MCNIYILVLLFVRIFEINISFTYFVVAVVVCQGFYHQSNLDYSSGFKELQNEIQFQFEIVLLYYFFFQLLLKIKPVYTEADYKVAKQMSAGRQTDKILPRMYRVRTRYVLLYNIKVTTCLMSQCLLADKQTRFFHVYRNKTMYVIL